MPSPALMMLARQMRASWCAAPDEAWRITIMSGDIASRLRAVSSRVSPFTTLDPETVNNTYVEQLVAGAKAAIDKAVVQTHQNSTALTLPVSMSVAGDKLTVTIAANDGAAQPAEVWLCPLSRSVPVAIGRGENHGRTITYTNVVKRWVKLGDWNGKSETFNVPLNDLHTADVDSVAVLVQSGVASAPKMMLGAAQASLK